MGNPPSEVGGLEGQQWDGKWKYFLMCIFTDILGEVGGRRATTLIVIFIHVVCLPMASMGTWTETGREHHALRRQGVTIGG